MATTAPTVAPSAPVVSGEVVERAVKALLQWKDAKSKSEKPQLLSSDEFLYLVVSLKKIPPKGRTNPHKIPLVHPLFSSFADGDGDGSDFCLFLDDRPGRCPTSEDAKAKIASEGIPISKVIKLSKLKSDYKPFEAKRKLCDSYDLFLADRRIIPLLPKLLGKHFYKKKKIPVAVDLGHQNWKEQVERVCGSALLHLKTGTCTVVRVARASLGLGDIVENVVAAINGVSETVPKKWKNVRSLHLKFSESVSLPIYQSVPETNLKIIGLVKNEGVENAVAERKKRGREEGEDEPLSRSSKKAVSKKGRIHQVRYMDDAVEKLLSEEESDSEDDGNMIEKEEEKKEKKKKKKNDDDVELGMDEKAEDEVKGLKKPAKMKKGVQLKGKKKSIKAELDGEVDRAKAKKGNKLRKVSNVAKSAI